ncbi:protein RnfH [Pseudoalteromonas luteoviolacea S2607]|uniref:RnfH family protein n=1 Tax=Pseudoalteromonas luteoviolacea TaxID=43657 RepID=UPI0007B0844F|nr:RnfH family protein [Pseudoalteromonas luteoviolacea]KZN30380.1 protein RnfH [Pseudoalteromonas luteoviolacea S2607]
MIKVEVVFALPDKATTVTVDVAEGTSAEQVVLQSGILERCPEIEPTDLSLGIWNRTVKLHQVVKDGDRIEVYRPLIADPKEARRRRADKAKEEGRANKITGGRAKA